MRKVKVALVVLLLLVILSGCARVVSETYEVVPAVVVSANYTPPFVTSSSVNGKVQTQYHAASGSVKIVCKGRNEFLGGVSFYERFYDHIGDEVWAIIRIRAYDSDKVKETVINLLETKEQAERLLDAERIDVGDTE